MTTKDIAKFVIDKANGRGEISLPLADGKERSKDFTFKDGVKGESITEFFNKQGDNAKVFKPDGVNDVEDARVPECLVDGRYLEVANVRYILRDQASIQAQPPPPKLGIAEIWQGCKAKDHKSTLFDLDLPWQGREQEMNDIERSFLRNMESHKEATATKQCYDLVIISGPSGGGKSRLGLEACKSIKLKYDNHLLEERYFASITYLLTDFSVDDVLSPTEILKNVGASIILGLRLASAFFLRSSVNTILNHLIKLGLEHMVHDFTLEAVMEQISSTIPAEEHIAILWHMDEFQHLSTELVRALTTELGSFILKEKEHKSRICILPLFTGTTSQKIIQEVEISFFHYVVKQVHPLKREESTTIIRGVLQGKVDQIGDELLDQSLGQLGDWPRFLQLFCSCFKRHFRFLGVDVESFLATVLEATRDEIQKTYHVDVWKKLMGGDHFSSLENMCLYALTRRRVKLTDKLNGLSVAEVRDIGILMLSEVSEGAEEFYIDVPLILIRALNKEAQFIDSIVEQLFNPRVVNEQTFEDQMVGMRILRGNLLATKQKSCTVAELYPGAIGHPCDLRRVISLKSLKVCRLAGATSGAHRTQFINYNMKSMPVDGATEAIDVTRGEYMAINVGKAASGDALTHHTKCEDIPALWELLQPKSSDVMRDGRQITVGSKAVLFTADVMKEVAKVNDSQHDDFFEKSGCTDRLLVVISNKPLAVHNGNTSTLVFEDLKNYFLTGESVSKSRTLPKGVIIISHENFRDYVPPFLCTHRLWRELASDQEEEEQGSDQEEEEQEEGGEKKSKRKEHPTKAGTQVPKKKKPKQDVRVGDQKKKAIPQKGTHQTKTPPRALK